MNKEVKQKYYYDAIEHLSKIISYIIKKRDEEGNTGKLTFFFGRFYYIDKNAVNKTKLLDEQLRLPFVGRFENNVIADINPEPTTYNIDDILKYCTDSRDSLAEELEKLEVIEGESSSALSEHYKLLKKIEQYFETETVSNNNVVTEERGDFTNRVLELAKEHNLLNRDPKFSVKTNAIYTQLLKEGFSKTTLESVRKTLNRHEHYSNKRKLK